MKRIACLLVAVAMFGLGWFSGRQATESKTDLFSVASEVLKAHLFNSAYTGVTFCQAVISQIDSGRIEDAKQMLRTHQDGSIFALDNALDPAPISSEDMIALRDLNAIFSRPTDRSEKWQIGFSRELRGIEQIIHGHIVETCPIPPIQKWKRNSHPY